MAEPGNSLVRLRSVVVVDVTSQGILCFANAVRLCIPRGEIHEPPTAVLKARAVVDMVVSQRFAREHRLL